MDGSNKTPLALISGFLGSGKTTLINRFLKTKTGLRIGVLVNEFGQIGIDGALLSGPKTDILELSDGCVCCASGRELWEAAASLRERAGVSHILLETSGLAEPAVLTSQYADLPEEIASKLDLRSTITLVDCTHLEAALTKRAETRHQIIAADRLLLSKVDLVDAERLLWVHRVLDDLGATGERASLSPSASGFEVAEILRWAFDRSAKTVRPLVSHAHHRESGQVVAISWQETAPLLAEPVSQFLASLPTEMPELLRAKGLLRFTNRGPQIVQLASGRLNLTPASEAEAERFPPGSTLVLLLSGDNERAEGWLRLRLSACRVPLQVFGREP